VAQVCDLGLLFQAELRAWATRGREDGQPARLQTGRDARWTSGWRGKAEVCGGGVGEDWGG